MKLWKHSLVTALAFFGICTMIVYSACDRDSCLTLKCKNQAPCVNGFCQCPTGYEGAECQIPATDRFTGTYHGHLTCNNTSLPAIDSAVVSIHRNPNVIAIAVGRKPGQTFLGTIDGNTVRLTDTVSKSTGLLVLDIRKISVEIRDSLSAENRECTFVGSRP
ncbi:MAG: hypothetical protein K0R82_1460 [Flavipsychrobacter sp.]|jgi:hypothetical protein|nr:hypothetical protein [Flavipsychrobacter sp.]